MAVNHPIIKYRLTKEGRVPEFLCNHEGAFAGMYPVNTNKPGYIPRWLAPQETQYLGMGCGPIDPDGVPDGVEVISTKTALQTYITGISTSWTNSSLVVTGISTSIEEGPVNVFGVPENQDQIIITSTPLVAYAVTEGVVVGVETSQNVSDKIITEDNVTTLIRTTTTIETSKVETPFDPIAATNELWDKYKAVNGL